MCVSGSLSNCCTRDVGGPVVRLGIVTDAVVSTSFESKAGLNRTEGSADAPKNGKELHRSGEKITRRNFSGCEYDDRSFPESDVYAQMPCMLFTVTGMTSTHFLCTPQGVARLDIGRGERDVPCDSLARLTVKCG